MVADPKRPGKTKKVKKVIPPYIPEHDALILAKVRSRAYKMDCGLFTLFGIRFGWESVIGIVPAFGDALGAFIALMIFKRMRKVEGGLDTGTQIQMLINIIIDFAVGLIPFVGDLIDAAFKANTKNVRLLERHVTTARISRKQLDEHLAKLPDLAEQAESVDFSRLANQAARRKQG